MIEHKKTLLIFFGEYRVFDLIIPQLKDLDKVDVVFSTWDSSLRTSDNYLSVNGKFISTPISNEHILNVLPSIKKYYIVDNNKFQSKHNTWKMYWHWKNAINNIENPEQYEKVILHRCDMISEWHKIINLQIENDVIYLQGGDVNQISYIDKYSGVWINDYCFYGGFDIMKRFINSFNKDNYEIPHLPIWDVLIENNIKYKPVKLNNWLLSKNPTLIEFVKYMNSNDIKIIDHIDNFNSKIKKLFIEKIKSNLENKK
jgi:hypothetical protein